MVDTLAFVLAGGEGKRLAPLTNERAKPAVPFGGTFRVIDFVLSNLWHSGIRSIVIPTQYLPRSLSRHIKLGHSARFGISEQEYIDDAPPIPGKEMPGRDIGSYSGTANAIAQHRSTIRDEEPGITFIFGGDHIYMMDYRYFGKSHLENNADLSIMAIKWPVNDAARKYGVLEVDKNDRVIGFEEKPERPKPLPDDPDHCLVSMGNYAWKYKPLLEELERDGQKQATDDAKMVLEDPHTYSKHDFGFDIIPSILRNRRRKVYAYDFSSDLVKGAIEEERGYWRDIGTITSYYDANMEVRATKPAINMYNPHWSILTYVESSVPAKFVHSNTRVLDSLVANGVIVSGATVERSIVSIVGRIEDGAQVYDSLLLGHNIIGKGAQISRAIVDKYVIVPPGETVGIDHERDLRRGFTLDQRGQNVTLEMLQQGFRCDGSCITVTPRKYEFRR
jgi:glucose-1-phosphate adenylyltransferase